MFSCLSCFHVYHVFMFIMFSCLSCFHVYHVFMFTMFLMCIMFSSLMHHNIIFSSCFCHVLVLSCYHVFIINVFMFSCFHHSCYHVFMFSCFHAAKTLSCFPLMWLVYHLYRSATHRQKNLLFLKCFIFRNVLFYLV